MNKLREIALMGLRGRKRQTILVIVAISLSIAFPITIFNLLDGVSAIEQEQRKDIYGRWEGAVCDVRGDVLESVTSNLIIDTYGISTIYGEVCGKSGDIAGYLGTMDDNTVALGNIHMQEGRFPVNKNEIALEMSLLDQLHVDYSIGKEITLTLGEPSSSEDEESTPVTKTFTLTGIMNNYSSLWKTQKNTVVSAVVSPDYTEDNSSPYFSKNIFFTVKDKYHHNIESLKFLVFTNGYLVVNDYAYQDLSLEYSGFINKLSQSLIYIIVIFITSVFVIFNILLTTFQQRKESLTYLKIIGADKGMFLNIILSELLYINLIAFPLGILLGGLFSSICFLVLLSLGNAAAAEVFHVGNYIIPIGLTFISIVMGSLLPVRDLVNSSFKKEEFKGSARKRMLKHKKLSKRKIVNHLHYPSLWKKIVFTMLPVLSFCIIMVSFSNCFVKYIDKKAYIALDADYAFGSFMNYSESPYSMSENELTRVKSTYGLESVNAFQISRYYPIILNKEADIEYQRATIEHIFSKNSSYQQICTSVFGIDSDSEAFTYYKSQIEKGNIDIEKFNRGEEVILYLPNYTLSDDKKGLYNDFIYKKEGTEIQEKVIQPGDTITIQGESGDVEVTVGGIIHTFSDYNSKCYIMKPYAMIASGSLISQLNLPDSPKTYQYVQIYSNKDANYFRTDKELAAIDTDLYFNNYRELMEQLKSAMQTSVTLAIVLAVSLYGITSMLQLSFYYTSFEKLQKKIGIIRSIGISNKEYIKFTSINTIISNFLALGMGLLSSLLFLRITDRLSYLKYLDIKIVLFVSTFVTLYFLGNLLLIYIPSRRLLKKKVAELVKN